MRRKDWEAALHDAIARHAALPFEWGRVDCITFPADCVLAMTGVDVIAEERGKYNSDIGAGRRLVANDCRDVGDWLARKLPEIHPVRMGRGDVGVIEKDGAISGVVCIGPQVVGKAVGLGLAYLPRSAAVRAFKVE